MLEAETKRADPGSVSAGGYSWREEDSRTRVPGPKRKKEEGCRRAKKKGEPRSSKVARGC